MNSNLVIRKMTNEDVPFVAAIEKETFSMPWSESSFKDALANAENIYMVAEVDGNIAGYCGMWKSFNEGQIYNMCVRKDMRKNGIGEKLFCAFLEEGIKKGMTAFTLEVRAGNKGAVALYEKCGFENVGTRKNFYDNPKEDAIIMWKYI